MSANQETCELVEYPRPKPYEMSKVGSQMKEKALLEFKKLNANKDKDEYIIKFNVNEKRYEKIQKIARVVFNNVEHEKYEVEFDDYKFVKETVFISFAPTVKKAVENLIKSDYKDIQEFVNYRQCTRCSINKGIDILKALYIDRLTNVYSIEYIGHTRRTCSKCFKPKDDYFEYDDTNLYKIKVNATSSGYEVVLVKNNAFTYF